MLYFRGMSIRDWMALAEGSACRPIDAAFVEDPRRNELPIGRGKKVEAYTYSIDGDIAMTLMSLRPDGRILCMSKRPGSPSLAEPVIEGIRFPEDHRHDYIELAYAWEGRLRQFIDGEEFSFEEGEFCIVDRETSHREALGPEANTVAFLCLAQSFFDEPFLAALDDYYIGEFLRAALRGEARSHQFLRFSPRPGGPAAAPLLDAILEEYALGAKGSRYILKGLVLRLLDLLIGSYDSHLSEAQADSYDEEIFARLDSFLREHYRSVSIERLTKAFNYNPDFYNRLIRRRKGMTYSRYLQSIRLAEAERLLREGDMPVDDVASEVGYENKGYFYKIFREKNGMSPAEYRRKSGREA